MPEFYGLGPNNNCLVLSYDGKTGVVELTIPMKAIEEFRNIGDVQISVFQSVPFQIVSQNDHFTVIRISLPKGAANVELVVEINPLLKI